MIPINKILADMNTYEVAKVTMVLYLERRLAACLQSKLERPVLPIPLDFIIVKYSVFGIGVKGVVGQDANPEQKTGDVNEHVATKCGMTQSLFVGEASLGCCGYGGLDR
jgi:hypothetical protein